MKLKNLKVETEGSKTYSLMYYIKTLKVDNCSTTIETKVEHFFFIETKVET